MQVAAEQILRVRDQIAATKDDLEGSQGALVQARGTRRATLSQIRDSREHLEGDLAVLERQQARIQAQLSGAGQARLRRADQAGLGSAGLAGQRPGRVALRQRWGRLHAGVDIAVPSGTPIRAADSGRSC